MNNNISIPAPLLSTQVSDLLVLVGQQAPDLYRDAELYKMTCFHLTVGVVPSGMPFALFVGYRTKYLNEYVPQFGDTLLSELQSIKPFILLHDSSPSKDVKEFLINAGVEEDRVRLLPSTLSYQDLKEGRLGPALKVEHLKLIKCAIKSFSSQSFIFSVRFTLETENAIDLAVQSLYDIYIPLSDHLCCLMAPGNTPATIISFGANDTEIESIQTKYPNEFEVSYSNFEVAIQQGLVPELASLYRSQAKTNLFGSQSSYSPIVHLTNCSGSGKTRACLELGRLTNVLFFKFGGSNGVEESLVGKALVSFLHNLQNKHRIDGFQIMNAALQRILFVCAKIYDLGLLGDKAILVDSVVKDYFVKVLGLPDEQKGGFFAQVKSILFDGLEEYAAEMKLKLLFDKNQVQQCLKPADLVWTVTKADNTSDSVSSADIESTVKSWLQSRHKALIKNHGQSTQTAASFLPPLLIVLDEAHSLMEKFEKSSIVPLHLYGEKATEAVPEPILSASPPIDVYRVFRSTIRFFQFYWEFSVTVTVSTVAKVEHFNPAPCEDPSYRSLSTIRLNDPILLLDTFDCYRVGVFVESSRKDWKAFLFSRERVLHVGTCGRPLWGLYFGRRTCDRFVLEAQNKKRPPSEYLQECIPIYNCLSHADIGTAFYKLGNKVKQVAASKFKFNGPIGPNEAAALLGLAAGLQKYPQEVDLAALVQYGPFPAVGMDMEKRTVQAIACSEGIFNGAARVLLIEHLDRVAEWLFNYVSSTDRSIFSQGEIGEIVNRVSILYALHKASRRECMEEMRVRCSDADFLYTEAPRSIPESILEPVGLESFLVEYVGREATTLYLEANPGLKGSFLGLSYFAYMGLDWVEDDPYNALANALSRGMGIAPRAGSTGFDTIMPLVLSDGRLSFVYIQIKSSSAKAFPTATLVCSSAPDSCLSNIDVDRPYCYIFQKYNDQSPSYMIYPKRAADSKKPGHQACLAITGKISDGLPGKFQELINLYSVGKKYVFVKRNASLLSTWRLPSNLEPIVNSCEVVNEDTLFLTMPKEDQLDIKNAENDETEMEPQSKKPRRQKKEQQKA